MKLKLHIALFLLFIISINVFAQGKIEHDKDVWYQLILIPLEDDSDPYTFEWIWRNTSWKDVIGFVDPKKMVNDGNFKMSDFNFMNPSSRMGVELSAALSIFESNKLIEGYSYKINDINFTIKNNGVVWQPDNTFLLMLVKLKAYPAGENDAGYAWW